MEQAVKKRSGAQDITKAFCIISVIFSHVVTLPENVVPYVYCFIAFAMSYFFIISGYNYHGMKGSYWQIIWKRFKQLIVPLFFVCLGFLLVMGVYSYFVYGSNGTEIGYSFLFSLTGQKPLDFGLNMPNGIALLIPSWFVWYMFLGYMVFYAIADWTLKSTSRTISIIALGVIITTACCVFKLNEIPVLKMFICIPFVVSQLLLGTLLAKSKILTGERNKVYVIINSILAFVLLTVLGYYFPKHGMFAGGSIVGKTSTFGFWEVPYTFLVGFLFTYYFMHFARLIDKVPVLSTFMKFVGRNSLWLYLIHMAFITFFKDALGIKGDTFSTPFSWQMIGAFVLAVAASVISIYLVLTAIKLIKKKIAKKKQLPESPQ